VRVHAASCTLLHLSALVAARTVMHVRASVCEHWLKPPSHQRAGNTGGCQLVRGGRGGSDRRRRRRRRGRVTYVLFCHSFPGLFRVSGLGEKKKDCQISRSLRSGCDEVGRDEVRLEEKEREREKREETVFPMQSV
jgi:hypothetical protein